MINQEIWKLEYYCGYISSNFRLIHNGNHYFCGMPEGSVFSGIIFIYNLIVHPSSFLFNFEGTICQATFVRKHTSNPLSAYYSTSPL